MAHRGNPVLVWIGCAAIFMSVFLPAMQWATKSFPATSLWVIVPLTLIASVPVSAFVLALLAFGTIGLLLLVERLRRKS